MSTDDTRAPHSVALVQSCTAGEYSATMFSVTSAKCGQAMYLLILEAPELGRGHPLAQLLSGRDAWERSSLLYDDAVAAIRKASERAPLVPERAGPLPPPGAQRCDECGERFGSGYVTCPTCGSTSVVPL